MEVERIKHMGCPKKTWWVDVKEDKVWSLPGLQVWNKWRKKQVSASLLHMM